jgi:hypothetical protein
MQITEYCAIEEIRYNQNKIINSRITALVTICLSLWILFSVVVYIRPIFWGYYTQIHASPFTLEKPHNGTIYAAPCIFEVTEPYFDNFTCNIRNIIYTSKILTCPDGYYCDNLDNRKVCFLNNTYFCNRESQTDDCLTTVSGMLGPSLFSIVKLDVNADTYTLVIILISVCTLIEVIIFALLYIFNWVMYKKEKANQRKFHGSWYTMISVIYYINLIAVPLITYALTPNVEEYKLCYDMSLIMFSRYGTEISGLFFIIEFGIGTVIYVVIFISMSSYLKQDEEHKRLLANRICNTEGFLL